MKRQHFNVRNYLRNLLFAVPIFFVSASVFGKGTIRGTVTDSLTAEPLVGANVFLLGTALGNATDLEGKYGIEGIFAGKYYLRISYIGYRTKDIAVTVEDGKTVQVDGKLVFDVVKGAAVTITAQAVGQDQSADHI
jgi:hypothetical protein